MDLEYIVEAYNSSRYGDFKEYLNERGAKGWQLVDVSNGKSDGWSTLCTCIFMREKSDRHSDD